jgi:hypothetical protein
MSKQTAVEWLFNKMITEKHTISEWNNIREEAKEMEKEQQEIAFNEALDQYSNRSFEQYYNETYKNENK